MLSYSNCIKKLGMPRVETMKLMNLVGRVAAAETPMPVSMTCSKAVVIGMHGGSKKHLTQLTHKSFMCCWDFIPHFFLPRAESWAKCTLHSFPHYLTYKLPIMNRTNENSQLKRKVKEGQIRFFLPPQNQIQMMGRDGNKIIEDVVWKIYNFRGTIS